MVYNTDGYDPYDDYYDDVYTPSDDHYWIKGTYGSSKEYTVLAGLHPIFDPKKVRDYLNQTKIWTDAKRVDHRIKDLDEAYTFNILKWLNKNTEEIAFAANIIDSLKYPDNATPYIWVSESALYKKLLKHYAKVAKITPIITGA